MESKPKQEFIFATTDFQTAVILRITGFNLLEVRLGKSKKKKAEFVFDSIHPDGIIAKDTMKLYWDYKLNLDARSTYETQEELKTRMFDILKR